MAGRWYLLLSRKFMTLLLASIGLPFDTYVLRLISLGVGVCDARRFTHKKLPASRQGALVERFYAMLKDTFSLSTVINFTLSLKYERTSGSSEFLSKSLKSFIYAPTFSGVIIVELL